MDTTIHTRRAEIAATRIRSAKPRTIIFAAPAVDRRGRRLHGRFDALLGAHLLVHATRQPLLDGARALASLGYPPETLIGMRRPGDRADSLTSTLGAASALTTKERIHGSLLFEPWDANSRSLEDAPVKKTGGPALPGRVTPIQGGAF
jgi:hypothetical protein